MNNFIAKLLSKKDELNYEWLTSPDGWSSHLCGYASLFGEMFATTSCEVTAMALRKQFAPEVNVYDWKLLDEDVTPSFDTNVFQISIGLEWHEIDHIVTIVHDKILDSWFKQYKLRAIDCDRTKLFLSPREYMESLILPNTINPEMQLFYWVP